MVDTKPLLKGFGAAVDVVGQLSTDRAINSRRRSSGSAKAQDVEDQRIADSLANGELIEDFDLGPDDPSVVPHSLGYVPRGAIVLKSNMTGADSIDCIGATKDDVTIRNPGSNRIVTLWVT